MGGTSVFTGTRVPIQALFDYIETGEILDEFLENFPSVTKDLAIQVLAMASKTLTSEKILMKILLDENLPTKLKCNFSEDFKTRTVKEMDWLGKKNGELLGLATFNGFDI